MTTRTLVHQFMFSFIPSTLAECIPNKARIGKHRSLLRSDCRFQEHRSKGLHCNKSSILGKSWSSSGHLRPRIDCREIMSSLYKINRFYGNACRGNWKSAPLLCGSYRFKLFYENFSTNRFMNPNIFLYFRLQNTYNHNLEIYNYYIYWITLITHAGDWILI